MTDPTEIPDGEAPEGAMSPVASYHSSTRDYVVDRTGEVMREAYAMAEETIRPLLVNITDPRDGVTVPSYVTKDGVEIVDAGGFDRYRVFPLWREGTAVMTRLESFIAHVLRFKALHSAIFVCDSISAPKLTAVFDYHPDGPEPGQNMAQEGQVATALAMRHRAAYAFPLSTEWKAWMHFSGNRMGMVDFATFLQDRIVDVSSDNVDALGEESRKFVQATGSKIGTASQLFEIAAGLQINESSKLREVRNPVSGEGEVSFISEHQDAKGDKLSLPSMFSITIPVFEREPHAYRILARFRYRKQNEGVIFWYELIRPDLTFNRAIDEACSEVAEQTGLPMFIGAPEKAA